MGQLPVYLINLRGLIASFRGFASVVDLKAGKSGNKQYFS
jgi:hypothetical protein